MREGGGAGAGGGGGGGRHLEVRFISTFELNAGQLNLGSHE